MAEHAAAARSGRPASGRSSRPTWPGPRPTARSSRPGVPARPVRGRPGPGSGPARVGQRPGQGGGGGQDDRHARRQERRRRPARSAAPSRATPRSVRPARSRGQISARNAAGPTTSSPNDCGEPSLPAPTAPTSVARFQVRYRRGERRAEPGPGRGRGRLGERDGRGLVDDAVRGQQPGGARAPGAGGQPETVERVPAAEQHRPGDARGQAAARGRARQRELGGPGEREQAQRARLGRAQPGADRCGAERQPRRPDREPERHAVPRRALPPLGPGRLPAAATRWPGRGSGGPRGQPACAARQPCSCTPAG